MESQNEISRILSAASNGDVKTVSTLLPTLVKRAHQLCEAALNGNDEDERTLAKLRNEPIPLTVGNDSSEEEEEEDEEMEGLDDEEYEAEEDDSQLEEGDEDVEDPACPAKPEWKKIDEGLLQVLLAFVRNDDIEAVSMMIDSKSALNGTCSSEEGGTVLHVAAGLGRSKILSLLLEKGAMKKFVNDPEAFDEGSTPLHWAAISGQAECCKILIDNGAAKDRRNNDKYTALHLALMRGHQDTFSTLLDLGCDPDVSNEDRHTCLHMAVGEWKSKSMVEMLLKSEKVDPAATDVIGWTPLAIAVDDGDLEIATLLLERGLSLSYGYDDEDIPLISVAARAGALDIVKAMIKYNRDEVISSSQLVNEGKTALGWAECAPVNSKEIIRALTFLHKRARSE